MSTDPAGFEEPIKEIPKISTDEIKALESWGGSKDSGELEAQQIFRGADREVLTREAETNEHNRNERFRNHYETVAVFGLYGVFTLFVVVGLTWFWQLLTPDSWHYLNAEQVAKLQNIVTGGIVASLGIDHIKKRLK